MTLTGNQTSLVPDGLIGIANPDEPIYRIFPLWSLEETIRLRQLVLITPHRWPDPGEALATSAVVTGEDKIPYRQRPLSNFLRPAYAQCWSRTEESDTLLRAYSRVIKDSVFGRNTCPGDEGVRVRSTPRKLLAAGRALSARVPGVSSFVGAVQYSSRAAISQMLADRVASFRNDLHSMGRGQSRAELLLWKRDSFAHENEVRIICVDERNASAPDILRIEIEPSDIFEEVTLDPRLATFERRAREAVISSLGYAGPFRESELYQQRVPEIILREGWRD